jgi:hypothetical protein
VSRRGIDEQIAAAEAAVRRHSGREGGYSRALGADYQTLGKLGAAANFRNIVEALRSEHPEADEHELVRLAEIERSRRFARGKKSAAQKKLIMLRQRRGRANAGDAGEAG